MKKLLSKGRVIVSFVSVFAILAVSILSMFTGGALVALADDAADDTTETVTYPLNGTYDSDFVGNDGDGVYYTDAKGTVVSDFTGYATDFITYAKGSGTQFDPYIIETANEFAAVVTGNLYDENGNVFSTQYVAFMVDENIKAFNLNNTNSTVDFSGDMTAEQVQTALKDAEVTIKWKSVNPFMGKLDGNGVEVYGLKATDSLAGVIPHVAYSVTITNLTVKNSYFYGDKVSAFIAFNNRPDGNEHAIVTYRNISAHNNVLISKSTDKEVIDYAGVVFGHSTVSDGTEMQLSDSLIYGNIAKHESRDITYGLVGKLHRKNSATINNCIIMDSVPHTLYYGSNAFNRSTFTNVYTNTLTGKKWYNYDGTKDASGELTTGKKYEYQYVPSDVGIVTAWFNGFYANGTSFVSSGNGYNRAIPGPMYNVDPTAVQGKEIVDGLDEERWTYNENGYPTPKLYKLKTTGAGVASYEFFEGDGSSTTPYIVTTAEEFALMLMCDNQNKNFKLGKDIAINDTTVEDWTKNAMTWFTSNDVPEFCGVLNGNGKTVSGVYYDGNHAGEYAGLIPVIGSAGSVTMLTVEDFELTAKSGAVGGIAGTVSEKARKIIKFDAITVKDTVKFSGSATKGGIVGKVGYSVAQITNCLSESAGLLGENGGFVKLNGCITLNAYPFSDATNVTAENIYTDAQGDFEGVTYVSVDDMIGNAAKDSMPGLNIPTSWVTVNNELPKPTGAAPSSEGVKGEPWSGGMATKFAGGSGTPDDPYQIETAEQLAYAIWKDNYEVNYILTADIYLNDINSPLWSEKIGCNEWFTHRTTKSQGNFKYTTLDGDGYTIYGLFFDHTGPQPEYVRVGLVPQMGVGSVIKNIAMSQAYLDLNHDIADDTVGTLVGCISSWNNENWKMDAKDAIGNAVKRQDDEFQKQQPKIINCMADASCYVSADQNAGGLVGNASGCVLIENCTYLGSMKQSIDLYCGGAIIGSEWSNGSTIIDCTSLPQTCDTVMGGVAGQTWRTGNESYVTVTWEDVYYFSKDIQRCADDGIVKLLAPYQRIGDDAVESMPGLDFVDEYDQEYYDADTLGYTDPRTLGEATGEKEGDATTWLAIKDGTPIPSIFAKHRTEEELIALSDTNFSPPEVTVSFVTNTDEIKVDDMVGKMYLKLTLPTISRDGYIFKGWHVFDDFSYLYDRDYFPPRDLQLFAEWEATGITQNFEEYTDTYWDYDSNQWRLNKPGARGGYKNAYVRNGAKSMHLLDTNTEAVDCLLNYDQMLEPGSAYTIKFWVATDKENNPATLLTLVHNEKPVYLDTQVAAENMAVVTGLKVGEWAQYSYSFTAQTKWISIRATGGSSLYFDDIVVGKLDGTLNGGKLIGVAGSTTGSLSPNTSDVVTVAALVSAIMACAIVAVISKKNLAEVID